MQHPELRYIERRSRVHTVLKPALSLVHRLWYQSITVEGRENILPGQPVIYAPNHRNALMDDLAILFSIPDQPVYLSRADIHRNKYLSRVLTFLKIMPVYRVRDGLRDVTKNREVFGKTTEVLKAGVPIVIFPEGNHDDPKRLRPLKKGVSRIAFQAEEESGYRLGVKIVPVGIDFEKMHFRSRLSVTFGEAIDVSEHTDLYRNDPVAGIRRLQEVIRQAIESLTIHIPDIEHYDVMLGMVDLCYTSIHPPKARIGVARRLSRAILRLKEEEPERWNVMAGEYQSFAKGSSELGIDPLKLPRRSSNFLGPLGNLLLAILGLAPAIYGAANNVFAILLALRMTRLFKDPQFIPTARFGTGLFLVPFLYIGQTALVWSLSTWWAGILYFISLPLSLIFSYVYWRFLQNRFWLGVRILMDRTFRKTTRELIDQRDQLIKDLGALIPLP